jgi:hypothetical protein
MGLSRWALDSRFSAKCRADRILLSFTVVAGSDELTVPEDESHIKRKVDEDRALQPPTANLGALPD